jgi:hypothetical protein
VSPIYSTSANHPIDVFSFDTRSLVDEKKHYSFTTVSNMVTYADEGIAQMPVSMRWPGAPTFNTPSDG